MRRIIIVGALTAGLGLGALVAPDLSGPCVAAAPAAKSGTESVTLALEGMTCGSCAVTIRVALKKLDGVKGAMVKVPDNQAVVDYDSAKVTPQQMVEAVVRAGYKAKVASRSSSSAAAPGTRAATAAGEGPQPKSPTYQADPSVDLGVQTRQPTAEEGNAFRLDRLVHRVQGQYVVGVDKGGPAEKAGLKAGDVLLALDANKIFSRDDVDDFLRVARPGAQIKALAKRARTYKEETVVIALGANKAEGKDRRFTWQYAGLGQLDAALAAARKDGKLVLVGLSGSDTCCPTTRFETGSLSQVLDDQAVRKASEKFVHLIVRRPHAYQFRNDDKTVPIPGIVFLDGQGKLVGKVQPDSAKQVVAMMNELAR